MNYYFTIDGTDVQGPCTRAEIRDRFVAGTIPDSTQICQEGTEAWQVLSTIIDVNYLSEQRSALASEPLSQGTTSGSTLKAITTKTCPMCGEQILFAAKKCKHCGEYLDPKAVTRTKAVVSPSDALGAVIMLLPLAATALMWFWVSNMTLLQNPSSTLAGIVIVTVLLTSGLIAFEANTLGMGSEHNGKPTTGPIGWFLCGLLLWIVALPAYLYARSRFGAKNYVVGGLAAALVFLGVAGLLSYAIEQQKKELRQNLNESQRRLRELESQYQSYR